MIAEGPLDPETDLEVRRQGVLSRAIQHTTGVLRRAIGSTDGRDIPESEIMSYLQDIDEKLLEEFPAAIHKLASIKLFPALPRGYNREEREGKMFLALGIDPNDKEETVVLTEHSAVVEQETRVNIARLRAQALLYHQLSGEDPSRIVTQRFNRFLRGVLDEYFLGVPESLRSVEPANSDELIGFEDEAEFDEQRLGEENRETTFQKLKEALRHTSPERDQIIKNDIEGAQAKISRLKRDLRKLLENPTFSRNPEKLAHMIFGFEDGVLPHNLQRTQG